MGVDPSIPKQRNVGNELGKIAAGDGDLLNQEQGMSSYEVNTLYPQMEAQQRAATSAQRGADAADLGGAGVAMQGELGRIAPGWQKALGAVNEQIGAGNAPDAVATGTNATATGLQDEAQKELGLGGSLSPDEQRLVKQGTRAGFADRGLALSNPAMFDEALNLDRYSNARQQQRQGFAESAAGVGTNVEGMNERGRMDWRSFLGAGVGMNQGALAPVLGMFGNYAANPTGAATVLGAGEGAVTPAVSYGSDVFNTNYNAQAAADIAGANNKAAMWAAAINSGGEMAKSGMSMACWVAREVYGEWNMDWCWFRLWLLTRAPGWLRGLYLRYGPGFAMWLHGKPRVKALVRWLMDGPVRRMHAQADEADRQAVFETWVEWELN